MHTFIHCSAHRIDSKLRATAVGLIRSSARSSSPSRLVVVASDIGAERIGSALHGRHLWLDNSSRPLCHPRHKFFDGGGWTAASFSRPAHCVPVLSFPLIDRVG
jgi:hypothetical protein